MQARYKYLNKRFTNKSGQSGFVLKYVNKNEVYFQFDSGYVGCFQIGNIKNGKFKDKLHPSVHGVGFAGDGEHKPSYKGKDTRAYKTWNHMLERCYDHKCQEKHPAYKGCSVAKEWHNFQVFAEWFEENYPNDGGTYQLDKDALVKGNRVYGPNTCCFLTPQKNTEVSLARNYRFISPNGETIEIFNLNKFCRENNLIVSHMCAVAKGNRNQHKGWTRALTD
jgi:hypothetical protein